MKLLDFATQIKGKFNKNQLSVFESIICLEEIKLASMGSNDVEGYQVFTPKFVVNDMASAIGNDCLDVNKTILEPTSGDGAFTVFILNKRLENIFKDYRENFIIKSLKALSTIYSIEMDKDLIEKQRNNIFTMVSKFILKNNIPIEEGYFDLIKCIITTNFMWAKFNTEPPEGSLFGFDIAYKMPEAEKNIQKSLEMPVWDISNDDINVHCEGVDLW